MFASVTSFAKFAKISYREHFHAYGIHEANSEQDGGWCVAAIDQPSTQQVHKHVLPNADFRFRNQCSVELCDAVYNDDRACHGYMGRARE